jgi:hypothetical protein
MSNRIRHRRNREGASIAIWGEDERPLATSPTALGSEIGDCVYFFRLDDLIKIGFTKNLTARKNRFSGARWTDLLAVASGTYEDEQALHRKFAEHRARHREWYHPAPQILAHINEIRERYGLPAISAW